jgi:hypothetical protein
MKSWITASALLMGLLTASGAWADDNLFTRFHADYDMEREGIGSADSAVTLDRGADGSYSYQSVLHVTGLASLFFSDVVTETSSFELVDGHPRAVAYSYSETGKHPSSETIQFDWDKNLALTNEGSGKHKVKLTPETCDTQLVQLQLAADMATGKPANTYKILNHGEVVTYTAELLPDARIRAGSTVYDAKVVALHDAAKGRTITLWMAPALRYLPVKILQEQTGKAGITLTLQSISFADKAPATATNNGK